jgi:hypothetical protein
MSPSRKVKKPRSLDAAVDLLAGRLKYPIESTADMRAAVGDMETTVAGVSMRFEDFAAALPVWWFPIVSQENFKEKALELVHNKAFRTSVLASMARPTVSVTGPIVPLAASDIESVPSLSGNAGDRNSDGHDSNGGGASYGPL